MMRIASLLVLAVPCLAQRTFVVDANNGPGTDFTDLPAAMAQAQHGDVYHVRPGSYSAFATDKGVALLGEPGAVVEAQGVPFATTVVVRAVPAGRSFAMRGFEVRAAANGESGVELNGLSGGGHLEDVAVRYVGTALRNIAVHVQACAEVTLVRCRSDTHLRLANSKVWLRGCDLRGRDELAPGGATAAVISLLGFVHVAGGTYRGGDAPSGRPAPGASLDLGEFVISGDATTRVLAGSGPGGASAVEAADGSLTLDPDVALVPTGGRPPIGDRRPGTLRVTPRQLAYLRAAPVRAGGNLALTLSAAAGDRFLLAASPTSAPQALFGMLALVDLTAHAGLAYGVLPAPAVTISYGIPPDPTLVGKAFALQAAVDTPSWPVPGLSNPAVVVVGR